MFGLRVAELPTPVIVDTAADAREQALAECRRRVELWDGETAVSLQVDIVPDGVTAGRPKCDKDVWLPRYNDVVQIGPTAKTIFAGMFMVVIGVEDGVVYGYVPTLMAKGYPVGIKPEHLCHVGSAEWTCPESELYGVGTPTEGLFGKQSQTV